MREKVGFPWTGFPDDMFFWARGGVASWGTLCGSLIPPGAIFELVAGRATGLQMISELLGWYQTYPFPSTKWDGAGSTFPKQLQTVANSPLCHQSISKWVNAANVKVGSRERADRCGKVSGDVAFKATELLNTFADGKFVVAFKPTDDYAGCLPCHRGANSMLDDQMGLANCLPCHDDPGYKSVPHQLKK
ncbi:MAG: C-GCAxxG-C-C family protein [Syntrophomonadaceae bacterium]|nr:C-GCAxxG-C-C family protein [Syntrophomonadaceae bacterium]